MRISRVPSVCLILLLVLGILPVIGGRAAAVDGYTHLDPGGPANMPEQVPVNVVFVGYESTNVNAAAFREGLPTKYNPVVRSRLGYGIEEQLGLKYTYEYNLVYADSAYENAFFSFLSSKATPSRLTLFQQFYNEQTRNVRDVVQNHTIDAPTVEKYLVLNAPAGVDTSRNTIYFINWWGDGTTARDGFKHHVYTKTGEPDPDTGYDFGANRESRKVIAWGGTTADDEETGLGSTRRIWFHDLSAGPESWTDNWNVDNPDLDGDGEVEYRMPPIWEYFTPGGYRGAGALTADLSKISRYVAINLLFTSSPLYPPEFTPELLPQSINLDVNTYEGLKGVVASERYQKPEFVRSEVAEVHRLPYTIDQQILPFTQAAKNCYTLFLTDNICYAHRPQYPAFANLFLYNALNIQALRDDDTPDTLGQNGELYRVYEAPIVNYAVRQNRSAPYLGFADDNYIDGTQSIVFNFIDPTIIQAGYGLSTTEIHEYGHHLNLSHPHDGYDSETGVDYGPGGEYYFAWAGDENNSMMSYIDVNWDFSQFDRDNTNRFQAAGYIANANEIAGKILASGNSAAAQADLAAADAYIGQSKAALAAHNYDGTFDNARSAYESVLSGAQKAGVTVKESWRGVYVSAPTRGNAEKVRRDSYVDKIGVGTHRGRP